jgi:hypothetical protein
VLRKRARFFGSQALFECRRTVKFFYVKQYTLEMEIEQGVEGAQEVSARARAPAETTHTPVSGTPRPSFFRLFSSCFCVYLLFRKATIVCQHRLRTNATKGGSPPTKKRSVSCFVSFFSQAKTRHDLWMDPFVTAVDRLSEMIEVR